MIKVETAARVLGLALLGLLLLADIVGQWLDSTLLLLILKLRAEVVQTFYEHRIRNVDVLALVGLLIKCWCRFLLHVQEGTTIDFIQIEVETLLNHFLFVYLCCLLGIGKVLMLFLSHDAFSVAHLTFRDYLDGILFVELA